MAHVNYIHNIPFISIFLTMFGGIITPLFSNGKIAQKIIGRQREQDACEQKQREKAAFSQPV